MSKKKIIYAEDLRQVIVEDKEIRGTAFAAIMKHLNAAPDVERCVCCGEIIPEGRQVCPNCEKRVQKPQKVKTRADLIREMTDEELAWELMTWRIETIAKRNGASSDYPDTQEKILKWLQEPAGKGALKNEDNR